MCNKCGGSGYSYSGKPCQFCSAGKKTEKLANEKMRRQHSKESWKSREDGGRNFDYGFKTNPKNHKYRSS